MLVAALLASGCGDDEKLTPGSRIVTASQLQAEAKSIGYPIYWLGEIDGKQLEFTDRADGRVYVRYIPDGAKAGTQDKYLTVGTYPMENAYGVVTAISKKDGAKSPPVKGGIAAVAPAKPDSVFVAFKDQDLQIEVYDPNPSAALEAATSGNLQQVK